jgi:PAS domain S-box-containing protein
MSEKLRLFLIQDEEDHTFLMRKTLERAGHHVTGCRSGADALIVLSLSQFDLIVLDQKLPDMAGIEFLQTLTRDGSPAPVLMIAGGGDPFLAAKVLRAGALDFIVKDADLIYLADLAKRVEESAARHRLQQTNRLLVEAMESARDGIMITDSQGRLEHVNGALEHLFGYARQELLGMTPRLFNSGLQPRAFFEDMWRTILARASWQGELVNKRSDGSLVDTSLTVSPIHDGQGRLTHFIGICRDISDRKRMERQLFQAQKMQSVGTLAGGVAHEFNNLLAGIQGYAALGLREQSINETIRGFLQAIVSLSERAANLTRQLLAFARKPALSRQPTAIDKLLSATAELIKSSLKIEVDMTVDNPAGGFLTALADANQLQQVLINLALNARDAMHDMPARPVALRLSRNVLSGELPAFPSNVPAGDYIVLEVEDHGTGMSQEVLTQALDPFFTTKEVGQGTGLGLPVAFGIMHGHQGFLTIASEMGKGTRVRLYLPRLREQQPATTDKLKQATTPEPMSPASRRVLVIDDEKAVLDVVRRFLEIAGHQVITATSGSEGLAILDNGQSVDLILLDLMIPREEGTINLSRFRERFAGVPVLLCTGLVPADQAAKLERDGAAGLLRKPFRMDELWAAVTKTLA